MVAEAGRLPGAQRGLRAQGRGSLSRVGVAAAARPGVPLPTAPASGLRDSKGEGAWGRGGVGGRLSNYQPTYPLFHSIFTKYIKILQFLGDSVEMPAKYIKIH